MKNLFNKLGLVALALVALAGNALAVDPTSLAEVATGVTTEITANKGMIFTIMGAVVAIAVLLMVFYKGKRVIK